MNLLILPFRTTSPAAALQKFSSPDLLHIYLAQCNSASSLQNMPSINLGRFASIKPVLLPDDAERAEYVVSYSKTRTVYRDTETGEESVAILYKPKVWFRVKSCVSYMSSPSLSLPAEHIVPLPSLLTQVTLYATPRLHRIYQISAPKPQKTFNWMIDYDSPSCLPPLSLDLISQNSVAMLMSVLFAIRPIWAVDILLSHFTHRTIFTVTLPRCTAEELKDAEENLRRLEGVTSEAFYVKQADSDKSNGTHFKIFLQPITRLQCVTAVQLVAYTYTNGPWRYIWIRRGLEIRRTPHLGVQAKSIDARFRGELLEQLKSTIKTSSGSDYNVFLPKIPKHLLEPFEETFKAGPAMIQSYNRCICDLPPSMTAWDGNTMEESCTKQSGFCNNEYLEEVRSRLLSHINALVDELIMAFNSAPCDAPENQKTGHAVIGRLDPETPVPSDLIAAMEKDGIPFFHSSVNAQARVPNQDNAHDPQSIELFK